jgi:hypothetical protein
VLSAAETPLVFSAGSASPVSTDSFTKKSALEHNAVARHQAARREQDDVAGHDFFARRLRRPAVAQCHGGHADSVSEALDRRRSALLLERAEGSTAKDDREHDHGVWPIPNEGRDCGGERQDEDERARELASPDTEGRTAPGLSERVAADGSAALGGAGRNETVRARSKHREKNARRQRPESLGRDLPCARARDPRPRRSDELAPTRAPFTGFETH